jgi:DNA polymerase III subunit epsilon
MQDTVKINLERDLIFFDVEATGLNIVRDRIMQIALIKVRKDGGPDEQFTSLVNPGVPINDDAYAVHGISAQDVANKPNFKQIAQKVFDFIGEGDLAGYNSNRFDIPILLEEFDRAGIRFDISKRRMIDVQRIFYIMEPRTLKAAYKFYCNQELQGAHDALNDVRATMDVFRGQLQRYENQDLVDDNGVTPSPIKNDIGALHALTTDSSFVDVTQRLKYGVDGRVYFNFGKYIGQEVDGVLRGERSYANWIIDKDFSVQVKSYIRQAMKAIDPNFRG